MRSVWLGFVALFLLLQYELWWGHGGLIAVHQIKQKIALQRSVNNNLEKENKKIIADVEDLKTAYEAIEERARNDLGLVKEGEVFYQTIDE